MMKPWTVVQLKAAMLSDLALCQTDFERANVRAICGREIRQAACRIAATRKLTPGEMAIAEEYGYTAEGM